MRILVAMSGGVDSSVVAGLLKEEGHEVIGITMKLWEGDNGEMPETGCCTASDSEDARKVASKLDIPYYVLDYTSSFSENVIDTLDPSETSDSLSEGEIVVMVGGVISLVVKPCDVVN